MDEIAAGAPSLSSQNENSAAEDNLVNQLKIDVSSVSNPILQHTCSEMPSCPGRLEKINSENDTSMMFYEEKCTEINYINKMNNIPTSHTETSGNQIASTEEQFSELSKNIQSSNASSDDEKRKVIVHTISDITEPSINQQTSPEVNMLESFQNIREYKSDSSDSSEDSEEDSESDSDDSSSDSESGDDVIMMKDTKKDNKKPKEESWLSVLGIGESTLPDISELNLNFNDEEEIIHMGNIESIIDTIVTVAGLPQLPAYDLDTLLFLEEGRKVLGYVLDVMGPVTNPVYILHMSSPQAIKDLQIEKGIKVYCAPRSQYTKYVLLDELMKIRGSDASWIGDKEVPTEFQEYSDDEQERMNKQAKKGKRKRSEETQYDSLPQGGPPRPNFRNHPPNPQVNRHPTPQVNRHPTPQVYRHHNPQNWNAPPFDPSVPPPGFGVPPFPMPRPMNRYVGPSFRPNMPGFF